MFVLLKIGWTLPVTEKRIAENLLPHPQDVQEKFFSNNEITKLAKKKYENRTINFSRTDEYTVW